MSTQGNIATFSITYDVRGIPPGVYNAYFRSDAAINVADTHGNACNQYKKETLFANVVVTNSSDVSLVDPVPNLVSGAAVKTSNQLLLSPSSGMLVSGVAADGVSQIIVRISTFSSGEKFKVTLYGDQSSTIPSNLSNEDGGLGNPGDTVVTGNQVTVTAGNATNGQRTYAFAVYRAPIDFTRPSGSSFKTGNCNGQMVPDDQLPCRVVSIQVQDTTTNTLVGNYPLTIIRPPVVLIHGLWADKYTWNDFAPLITNATPQGFDNRFHVGRLDYSGAPDFAITSSIPSFVYAGANLSKIKSNSLGFQYNAPRVLPQLKSILSDFRNGKNPAGIPVAASQADLVGHSMGGLIARQMVLVSGYSDSPNFGKGYIHKLITIATPHLGTPLPPKLIDPANQCFRGFLEKAGDYPIYSVNFSNGDNKPGAISDLTVNPNGTLSPGLQGLTVQGSIQLRAALIAGRYSSWSTLDCPNGNCPYGVPDTIRRTCASNPLTLTYSGANWSTNFGAPPNDNSNDGLVSVTSQSNGQFDGNGSTSLLFPNMVHTCGLVGTRLGLGFAAPSELDSECPDIYPPFQGTVSPIAQKTIDLLNTPLNQSPFNPINP